MAVIGDGFGMFSALMLAAVPGLRVVIVNLKKTLFVDLLYLGKAVDPAAIGLVTGKTGLDLAISDPSIRAIAIRADDSRLLRYLPAKLVVNIASMREMEPPVIDGYFNALRAMPSEQVVFYCCNREEKILPDGTTVRFADYPWRPADRIIDDGLCPWHQRYYSWRPPFFHPYDGPTRHRLARLALDAASNRAPRQAGAGEP